MVTSRSMPQRTFRRGRARDSIAIRGLPFADRRALLEELARAWAPPLNMSPATRDRAVAETWFQEMPATGVEGILIKVGSQAYEPRRIWLKVKSRDAIDVV